MNFELFLNIFAVATSSVAILALWGVAKKFGGVVGAIIKLILIGVFFSVFLHSLTELVFNLFDIFSVQSFMITMSVFLNIGIVFFIVAFWKAHKELG